MISVNGVIVEAMADSGAEVSCPDGLWYMDGMDIQTTDADGRGIPCLGYVQVDLKWMANP